MSEVVDVLAELTKNPEFRQLMAKFHMEELQQAGAKKQTLFGQK